MSPDQDDPPPSIEQAFTAIRRAVLDEGGQPAADRKAEAEAEPAAAAPLLPPKDGLVSPDTAVASSSAFAKFAKAVAPPPPPASIGAKTVEELMIELLRPMLKQWLDEHLPEVVERVVEQEVKKLARRAELL